MTGHKKEAAGSRRAGYTELIDRYRLEVIPNWHRSWIGAASTHRTVESEEGYEEVYPSKYWPGDSLGDHLEFALKYDGTNLAILDLLFQKVEERDLVAYVRSKPTGKYARRIWFLYEHLSQKRLPLEDLNQGNYVDLLDPKDYYTTVPAMKIKRQRIDNNLLGDHRFCPMVRRTETLRDFESAGLPDRCRKIVDRHSPEVVKRALQYLYTKETKSSFAIEHVKPTSNRIERFVELLHAAEREDFCAKKQLIDLQNQIVEPRFRDSDYRTTQNYVGETVAWQDERIHFVAPKPEDVSSLMDGWVAANRRMEAGDVPAAIQAAVTAYSFVFLHPFEDGNGRIHRFLIHNILALRGFTPKGMLFPISAVMLKKPATYDESLEAFSLKLMPLVEYTLDEDGRMTVHGDTASRYRYMDMTPQAEALFRFIDETIDSELAAELQFLTNYDRTKDKIQAIVDMPDRHIDLFIRFCLQNNGRLSSRKRESHFEFLSSQEVEELEAAVRAGYGEEIEDGRA